MNTKLFILLLLFVLPPLFGCGIKAQKMSDDQVLSYIAKETQKGTSQGDIATHLITEGVTMTQLQRVRRKAERLKAEGQPTNNITTNNITRQKEVGIINDDSSAVDSTSTDQDYAEDMDQMNERQVFGRNIFSSKNLTFELIGRLLSIRTKE